MTIDIQPQPYSPANAPNIYQLTSANPNIINFDVKVLDAVSGNLIANQKYQTLPNLSGGTAFDLSSILSNLTAYQLNVSNNIVESVPNILKAYKLNITENIISGNTITTGATLTSDTYKVWNGSLSKIDYNHYNYNDFVMQAATGATSALFLTDKPNYSKLHYYSTELLYLLNKDVSGYTVTLKLYDKSNHYIGLYSTSASTYSEAIRINVSPMALAEHFNIDFRPVKYFTVQVADLAGNPKTKLRFYQYEQLRCTDEPVIFVFANSKGGFDSCFFLNPKESVSVTRNTIERYPYSFNSAGDFSNISNNIYNKEKETIGIDSHSTYTVISQPLNDVDSRYLRQLYTSPEVYVKLNDGTYLPVTISNNTYEVGRIRYSNGLVRQTLQFTAEPGLQLINVVPELTFSPPNIPYVVVDSYCYPETDFPTFGYVEPGADGDAIIEDGI
ncbi:hypothetical protein [Mucilaginibacter psychrotolerans]|uniref:Uncharacterized protein n=1 Tax=Mucilaginibacter psychrotolerans TaxID=1524096 RepID=A0A4Y8S5X1_9SPHI|nr:hypothetical protein [Mucilaginibacter psychrotolerans]TFF34393.1 hypothetical protein E2R66_22220 [Mucilaginibacter psychrotolerans]